MKKGGWGVSCSIPFRDYTAVLLGGRECLCAFPGPSVFLSLCHLGGFRWGARLCLMVITCGGRRKGQVRMSCGTYVKTGFVFRKKRLRIYSSQTPISLCLVVN